MQYLIIPASVIVTMVLIIGLFWVIIPGKQE